MTDPQRIGALRAADVRDRLSGSGLALDFGFVKARVRSDVPGLGAALQRVYAEFPAGDADGFFDVTASVTAGGLRRYVRPQIEFFVDGTQPFEPFPADTHLPLLEWGLNWCIAQRSNTHLLLHAGVVEKNGLGIVLPALPGSGKSTLVAALIARGYRLLSDEFGVVRQSDGMLLPLLKPVALKDASIDVIRRFAPASALGPVFPKTRKGDVAHLAPPAASTARRHEPAAPALFSSRSSPRAALALERCRSPVRSRRSRRTRSTTACSGAARFSHWGGSWSAATSIGCRTAISTKPSRRSTS
jgi:HprK-related kinase A